MTQGGSKFMKIKFEIGTDKVKVKDENNKKATVMTKAEVEQECPGDSGLDFVGEIFHCQFNPTCMYLRIGSTWYRICY
jgi:hypothetical protein